MPETAAAQSAQARTNRDIRCACTKQPAAWLPALSCSLAGRLLHDVIGVELLSLCDLQRAVEDGAVAQFECPCFVHHFVYRKLSLGQSSQLTAVKSAQEVPRYVSSSAGFAALRTPAACMIPDCSYSPCGCGASMEF